MFIDNFNKIFYSAASVILNFLSYVQKCYNNQKTVVYNNVVTFIYLMQFQALLQFVRNVYVK